MAQSRHSMELLVEGRWLLRTVIGARRCGMGWSGRVVPWGGCVVGAADLGESDSSVLGVVGGESLLVDDDLMVVPAEGDQIVGVCCSALAPWDEMVDLESMVTGTAVGLAAVLVAVEDGSA